MSVRGARIWREGADGRFLPFFAKGNLQDVMNENALTRQKMDERLLLELFHGTCLA